MLSKDGCRADEQACKAAEALVTIACLWCTVETISLPWIVKSYRNRIDAEEGEKSQWARGFQVRRTFPSTCGFRFLLMRHALVSSVPGFLFCCVFCGSAPLIHTWMHRRARRHSHRSRRCFVDRGGCYLWLLLHLALYPTMPALCTIF